MQRSLSTLNDIFHHSSKQFRWNSATRLRFNLYKNTVPMRLLPTYSFNYLILTSFHSLLKWKISYWNISRPVFVWNNCCQRLHELLHSSLLSLSSHFFKSTTDDILEEWLINHLCYSSFSTFNLVPSKLSCQIKLTRNFTVKYCTRTCLLMKCQKSGNWTNNVRNSLLGSVSWQIVSGAVQAIN